ncbi:uncharacterized protein BuS5_03149 [Desulfosarcina sp. BuS5]|uniref:TAXI family TRAP transporter solute-binding subunit n=1 Tax=Desulfosarcina sp. BuS5 TaxID=933262 RepID=UPI0004817D91|nr:TAXI family TRAP transporter solute-binding subunit [Desulfosarcina sp. BuS5]WDN90179.1 uncharacterized protein BuS5_03149 [Desulfosarcina sp. BuS5]
MKPKQIPIILICCTAVMIFMILTGSAYAMMYRFSGGPSGGTFQYYASAVSTLSKQNRINVLASSSGGSIENIRLANSGKASFAVAYSGHLFQAENGLLPKDTRTYKNVLAVCYLYGAPAQLVVRADSGITETLQLAGKRVGTGNAGSGAAANCELFFSELGLWDKIKRNFLGYRQAADAFKNKQLDAFWIFSGFPNSAVIETALQNKIKLINLYPEAEKTRFLQKYPYFTKVVIPADTYKGVSTDTITFQDATLWVANKKVPADLVYRLLKIIYSQKGLEYMVSVHKSARAMSIQDGIHGIITPLHPGAAKFWQDNGILK